MLGLKITTFGTHSKTFGFELETQLTHYERYFSKRFLLMFDGSTKMKPHETVD